MLQQSMILLQSLFNAGDTPFFMTAEEGQELSVAGLITVDPNAKNPQNPLSYQVRITEAGANALMQSAPTAPTAPAGFGSVAPVAPPVPMMPQTSPQVPTAVNKPKPTFEIEDGVAVPAIVRTGNAGNLKPRTSNYPFDQLQVNQSFHVAATAEDPEPHKKMASNVSAANKRSEVEAVPAETVTTKHKRKQKDAQGNTLKDANGKDLIEHYEVTGPKMVATKKFVARQVNASDLKGPGVRVFRVS